MRHFKKRKKSFFEIWKKT